uniref:Uncharacterized protein n=1 Tax=Arundo donax TaxID=35708 RepID=A0A0A9BRT7_ARUDO
MRSRRRFSASRWLRDAASARSWAAAAATAAAASSSSEVAAEAPPALAAAGQMDPMKKGGSIGKTAAPPSPCRAAPAPASGSADTSAGNMMRACSRSPSCCESFTPPRLSKLISSGRRARRTEPELGSYCAAVVVVV